MKAAYSVYFLLTFLTATTCLAKDQSEADTLLLSENMTMTNTMPNSRRPAPPEVEPIEHKGVRYEQDMHSSRYGGTQPGGYLVAIDPETGARLWMLKVYEIPTQADAPFQPGRYFRNMHLLPDSDEIEIESEVGGKYLIDLSKRTSTWLSGPDSVHQ